MSVLDRVRSWVRDLRETPQRSLGRGQRAIRYVFDLVLHCARELRRDRAEQMAAALTYRTLFSLLPTLALALVILQVFVGPAQQAQFKESVASWILAPLTPASADNGPSAVPPAPGGSGTGVTGAPAGDGVANGTGATARVEFEQARQALEQRLEEVTSTLEGIDFGSIGLVGLLLFLYAATGLLGTIEKSFDRVFKTRRKRPWHLRLPLYYTVITVGPILLLAGLYLRGEVIGLLAAESWTSWLGAALAYASPLLSAWLLLFVMFVAIPNTRVNLRAAAIGALIAALLVGLTAELFRAYIAGAAIASLYGALALLPMALFWLYLLWLLILFGLEVAFAFQTVRNRDWHEAAQQAEVEVEDVWAIPLAVEVARAFDRGELVGTDELSSSLGLARKAVRELVEALLEAGLVREVEEKGKRGFVLARPAHRIAMNDLFETARPLPSFDGGFDAPPGLTELLESIHRAGLEQAASHTLADFTPADRPDQADPPGAADHVAPESRVG